MHSTLLRLGLWLFILVLALYVVQSTYSEEHWAELIATSMLQQVLILSVVLIVAGILARLLGKGAKAVAKKNRCAVCKTAIPPGAIYCRTHLRSMIQAEDDKTHMTRVR